VVGVDWVERALSVRRYARGGERAAHKPLLLLYALGRFQQDGDQAIPFSAAEDTLRRLLREFGPPRETSPVYPFHHLTNDDRLWVVETPDGPGSPGPTLGGLRRPGVQGRLHPELVEALSADPSLVGLMARALLEANFEQSLHQDICQEAGLDLEVADLPVRAERALPARDPQFRLTVLEAYDYTCAFCGYDGLLDGAAVGLDAAHLRWRAYDGPDDLVNGLCLCALHHRLLDRGVLGLTSDRTITVSRRYTSHSRTARTLVLDLSARPARPPGGGRPLVAPDHIAWHTDQVFRAPAFQQ
jgi:putative restriction endonuclease